MSVCVCLSAFPANLSHLCQVQGGTLLLGILGSPALHPNLFVIQHAWLGPAPRKTPFSPGSLSSSPPQLWGGVWGAGLWCLFPLELGQADLLMGKRERPEEDLIVRVVMMLRGRRGRGDWRGSELMIERQSLVEEWQVQGSVWGEARAWGQAEAGAALHCGKMASCSPSDASSTVAPAFLHRRPDPGALGPPRWAEAAEFVRQWQGATLAFARGCRRSLTGGCSGVLCSGGGHVGAAVAQIQISYQVGDSGGTAWFLGPVSAPRLRDHIPKALQTTISLTRSCPLDGIGLPQVQPSICLCNSQNRQTSRRLLGEKCLV